MVSVQSNSPIKATHLAKFGSYTSSITNQAGLPVNTRTPEDEPPQPEAPGKEGDSSPNARKKTFRHRFKMALPVILGNGLQLGGLVALLKNAPGLAATLFIPGLITEIVGQALIARDHWFARKKAILTELAALSLGLGAFAAVVKKNTPVAIALGGTAMFLFGKAHEKFSQAWKAG